MKLINKMRPNLIVAIALLSCTSKTSEKSINHQAIILHNSMIKKANHIEHRLNKIRKDTAINRDSIAVLSTLLKQWKANLADVAANENHDHINQVHNHRAPTDLTDEQMLAIQSGLDEKLSAIGKRISQLKTDMNDHEHIH